MSRKYILIMLSMLVSLFVYLFYRTEKTVINQLAICLLSQDIFDQWRDAITQYLPLHNIVVYSLPEGLWVFCIALTSKFLFIKFGTYQLSLTFLPLILAIGMELFQLLQVTNGRFDFWDIAFSVLFWIIPNLPGTNQPPVQNIAGPFTLRGAVCVMSYLVVFLAHVER